jgi:hypothetical protein
VHPAFFTLQPPSQKTETFKDFFSKLKIAKVDLHPLHHLYTPHGRSLRGVLKKTNQDTQRLTRLDPMPSYRLYKSGVLFQELIVVFFVFFFSPSSLSGHRTIVLVLLVVGGAILIFSESLSNYSPFSCLINELGSFVM